MQPIIVIGKESDIGGAGTELRDTVKLWRDHGLNVTVSPIANTSSDEIAVGFCSARMLHHKENLRGKTIWLGCMTCPFSFEEGTYKEHGLFDKYVFQSKFQQDEVAPFLLRCGAEKSQFHLIRGAFEQLQFKPRPHEHDAPFVIGRVSRAHPQKFSRDTWEVYERIKENTICPIEARVLGWHPSLAQYVGKPPDWVETLPECAVPVQDFYHSLHAVVQFGTVDENWPRIGLEAMSAGVPLIVPDRGGWREMVHNGFSGYLCADADQVVSEVTHLALIESWRMDMIHQARVQVEQFADPERIWGKWEQLFEELG